MLPSEIPDFTKKPDHSPLTFTDFALRVMMPIFIVLLAVSEAYGVLAHQDISWFVWIDSIGAAIGALTCFSLTKDYGLTKVPWVVGSIFAAIIAIPLIKYGYDTTIRELPLTGPVEL